MRSKARKFKRTLDRNARRSFCLDCFGPGDIIGFSGHSWLSSAINIATYGIPFWSLSHLGIIGRYQGKKYLFESTMNSSMPCAILDQYVDGVQAHHILECIDEYPGKVWHYQLDETLDRHVTRLLTLYLLSMLGEEYDKIGAIRAGGLGFSWIESLLRKEDLSSLFCSEFCAAAHRHSGLLDTRNVSKWSPNRLVRYERKHGILQKPRRLK